MNEVEIRADERRKVCAQEGHDWKTFTTMGERARGIETEICGRCGASAVTTRVVKDAAGKDGHD